jgi:hypothetical protein
MNSAYCTVNEAALLETPPLVVTAILPVFAPVGTIAVICVSEFTVKLVAMTPPKVSLEAWVRLTPVMITEVPTRPAAGVKLFTFGKTLKMALLVRVVDPVVMVTDPVSAPAGTGTVM